MIKYVCINKHVIKDMVMPVTNYHHCGFSKPFGGLWTSTYTPNDEYISDWDRGSDDMFGSNAESHCSVITLKDSARIYTIDGHNDLTPFVDKYKFVPNDKTMARLSSLYSAPIDFEKVSQDYDCIHLTFNGQINTRFNWNGEPYTLYGWDTETMLILNKDCIDTIEHCLYEDLKKTR